MPYLILTLVLACADPAPAPPPATPDAEPEAEARDGEDAAVAPGERNREPVIREIRLVPEVPTVEEPIGSQVRVVDPEDGYVRITRRWLVNGAQVARDDERLEPSWFRKGDQVQLEVEASDGEASAVGRSRTATVANSVPLITNRTSQLSRIQGFQAEATDADGDLVTFRLEGAPPGLSIEARTGLMAWNGRKDDAGGDFVVTLVADDGDGGEAFWTFGLSVTPGSDVASATGTGEEAAPEEAPAAASASQEAAAPPVPTRAPSAEPADRWERDVRPEKWEGDTRATVSSGRDEPERWRPSEEQDDRWNPRAPEGE